MNTLKISEGDGYYIFSKVISSFRKNHLLLDKKDWPWKKEFENEFHCSVKCDNRGVWIELLFIDEGDLMLFLLEQS